MERRNFLGRSLAGGLAAGAAAQAQQPNQQFSESGGGGWTDWQVDEIHVERKQSGKPHKGKMLAAIQPHTDDIPIYAGGTVLKLIDEGYEGILINMSNDEMAGRGATFGEVIRNNELDTREVARRMGLKETVFLNYRNHIMDGAQMLEMRARLIFLFRVYKIDTNWGMHLTPEAPRSSIRALEDYSRTLGSFKSASPSGFKVNRCRPPAGRNERRL